MTGHMEATVKVFELEVGDAIEIGGRIVTVVDIDGENVSVRIDPNEAFPFESDEHHFGVDPIG